MADVVFSNVNKTFGAFTAVHGLTLAIEEGEEALQTMIAPSTLAAGYRYAEMGYTTVMEAAPLMSLAGV